MPPMARMRAQGTQREQPYPIPDQASTYRPNPVSRGRAKGRGRTAKLGRIAATEAKVDQLATVDTLFCLIYFPFLCVFGLRAHFVLRSFWA